MKKIEKLIIDLEEAEKDFSGDPEIMHGTQDELLLKFINNDKVREIFERSTKWYA